MLWLSICFCTLNVRTRVCVWLSIFSPSPSPSHSSLKWIKQTNVDIFHFYCFFNCIFLFGILFLFLLLPRSQSVLFFSDCFFSVCVISTIAYFQFMHKICLNRFVVPYTHRRWLKMNEMGIFIGAPVQWFVLINGLNCGIRMRGANQQKEKKISGTRINSCIHELKMIGFEMKWNENKWKSKSWDLQIYYSHEWTLLERKRHYASVKMSPNRKRSEYG